jgi:hypothetical protein
MDFVSIIVEVNGSYGHVFLDCLYLWDVVFLISIKYFGLFYFGGLSKEDCLQLFGNAIFLVLILESMKVF